MFGNMTPSTRSASGWPRGQRVGPVQEKRGATFDIRAADIVACAAPRQLQFGQQFTSGDLAAHWRVRADHPWGHPLPEGRSERARRTPYTSETTSDFGGWAWKGLRVGWQRRSGGLLLIRWGL